MAIVYKNSTLEEVPKSQEAPRILVVDDEKVIREILNDFLTSEGYEIVTAENGKVALALLEDYEFDVVLTDLKMPVMDGIELIEHIYDQDLDIISVMMTGFGTVETAIKAMKVGAYDYILKPFKVDEVVKIVGHAIDRRRLEKENVYLKELMGLYKIGEAMSSTLNLDEVMSIILDTISTEVGADVISLYLSSANSSAKEIELLASNSNLDFDPSSHLNPSVVIDALRKNGELIEQGPKINKYFVEIPEQGLPMCMISVPLKIKDRIEGIITCFSYQKGHKFVSGHVMIMAVLGSRASSAIENARLYERIERALSDTIQGLVTALEAKDRYTSGHTKRVTEYAIVTAKGMGMDHEEIERISRAGLLHDIGKIGIQLEALNKPEKLTFDEVKMFKEHPAHSKEILSSVQFLHDIVPDVYYHHERYDGSGYPEGISGEKIPIGARILAVADSFDAMTSDRPYRKALSRKKAFEELKKYSGTQFDPRIVEVFIRELKKSEN